MFWILFGGLWLPPVDADYCFREHMCWYENIADKNTSLQEKSPLCPAGTCLQILLLCFDGKQISAVLWWSILMFTVLHRLHISLWFVSIAWQPTAPPFVPTTLIGAAAALGCPAKWQRGKYELQTRVQARHHCTSFYLIRNWVSAFCINYTPI